MSRKMIFLDLDNTLLASDKTVSDENMRALEEARARRNYVAVATGRSFRSGKRIMEELSLDGPGCYLLAFQGSVLYDWGADRVLFTDGIDGETAAELLEAFEKAGIYAHTFWNDRILTLHESGQLWRYNRIAKEPYQILRDLSQLKGKVCQKVIAVDYEDHERLERFRESYRSREEGKLNSFFSSRELLEYCKLGIHKGSGLEKLAKLLGVEPENTVAVGDEENDLSMIRAAGIGVAMKNAQPQVKAAADYVTKRDCDHSGVAEVIEKFLLESS